MPVPGRPVDWTELMTAVEHHGMGPHVRAVLERTTSVPEAARVELRHIHRRATEHGRLLSSRLLQLLDAFSRAGVPVMTLKGPGLAQQLYGEPGMRDSLDLDLLVPSTHVDVAAQLLRARGYWLEPRLRYRSFRELAGRCTEVRFRNERGVAVDLRWASAPADYPCRIPEARLWSAQSSVSIGGQSVPVLSRECLLVYLCVDGTRHCWPTLRWLCDVALLVTGADEIAWEVVDSIAAESHATRALDLGLRLAHGLLGVPVPTALAARVTADKTLAPLVVEVAACLQSTRPTSPTASPSFTWFHTPVRTARRAAKFGRELVAGHRSFR